MVDILSLVDRHERWRADSCINLQPSENLVSPQVKRALGSDLAGRYTLPWKGDYHGARLDNAYGGTRYLDEIEAAGEALARELFEAKHASLKPLSGHLAAMLLVLTTCRRKDRIFVIDGKHGGYDGYLPPYIPEVLGLRLKVDFLPFREDAWRLDTAAAARKIRAAKPALVVLGASFLLFPYEMAPLREAADAAGALIGYDGSHVLGLVAGGVFQRPLPEGADVLVGSTHKSLFGPQGGLFLCNRADVWGRAMKNTVWRLFSTILSICRRPRNARAFNPPASSINCETVRSPFSSYRPGLFTLPAIAATGPIGGMKITSSGKRRGSPALSPLRSRSYMSKRATACPPLRIWMSRIDPDLVGPPAWIRT
ncbi:MAG: hypothetical protein AABY30_03065 [Candidatus Thermoplasmatota archaeon]